jgi:hypothetical protein
VLILVWGVVGFVVGWWFGGLGGGQIALVWMAVLEAGVTSVKMGADTVLTVAELVPVLRLKDKGYATPT